MSVSRRKRSFCFFAIILACVGLALTVFYLRLIQVYPMEVGNVVSRRLATGMDKTLKHLQEQGDDLAQDQTLIESILLQDDYALLAQTKDEVVKRGVGMIGIANKDGVMVSRSLTSSARGDNVFLTTPLGRALSISGESQASVENTKFNGQDQAYFTTGRYILFGQEKIGLLFANQLADSDFAKGFKGRYLPKSEVVFYTIDGGLYGTSMEKGSEVYLSAEHLILPNSEWVLGGDFTKLVILGDELYLVRNIHVQGLEGIATGVSVFTPLPWLNPWIYITCFIVFGLLLSSTPLVHAIRNRHFTKQQKICILIFFAQLFIWSGLIMVIWERYSVRYEYTKGENFEIYNSTLALKPESGVFVPRTEQKLDIYLGAGGEEINAYRIDLLYNPRLIAPKTLGVVESACPLPIANETTSEGLISFSCAIPMGKSDFGDGKVATLVFEGIAPGIASFAFASTTAVYAGDGLETQVLRTEHGAQFTIQDVLHTRKPSLFYSHTHPDANRWYRKEVAKVVWQPTDSALLYLYNKEGKKIGEKIGNGKAEFFLPEDGEYTITVNSSDAKERLGMITVKRDMTPPEQFELQVSSNDIKSGGVVRFSVKTSDKASGLQRMAYVQINDGIFYPTKESFSIPFESRGNYTITVKIYDVAGNSREAKTTIKVR